MSLTLKQICSVYNTDKNTCHSYIDEVYDKLFAKYRYSTSHMLEVGVNNGASLLMWAEYFSNSKIYGIDINACPTLMGRSRINVITGNAYSQKVLELLPNEFFDIIIDDGSHIIEDQLFVIKEYVSKLKHGGLLIIEDIQKYEWVDIIKEQASLGLIVSSYDLRTVRNRYDDILLVAEKPISSVVL